MAMTAPIYMANSAFDPISPTVWNNPGNASDAPGADYSDCTVDSGNPPASFLVGDVPATPILGTPAGIMIYASISSAAAPVSAGIQVYLNALTATIDPVLINLTTSAQTTYSAAATIATGSMALLAAAIAAGMDYSVAGEGYQVEGTSASVTPTTIRVHGVWAVVSYAPEIGGGIGRGSLARRMLLER